MIERIRRFLFLNQSVRQTIAKNTFWLSFGEIAGRVLRTGVVIYAARVLGPAGWGTFSYMLSISALLTIFSDIGLSAVLIREGAKNAETRAAYFSTAFFLKFALIILSFLAILLLTPHLSTIPLSRTLILWIAFLFLFDALRGFGVSLFRAVERMEREALVNIATQTIILGAGFFALIRFATGEALAAAYAIGAGAGLLLTVYLLRNFVRQIFSHFDPALVRPILWAAWPFSITGILSAVMLNTDSIMIGWLRGAAEVGFYAAAQKPILFLYLVPSLIAGGFFPALARSAETDKERFRRILEKGLKVVFLAALPAAVGLFLTADDLVTLLYGDTYRPSVASVQILALTLVAAFPMSLFANAIFAYNEHKALIRFGMIGALGNVVLNFFLIPLWGISGAAWATLITHCINTGLIWRKMNELNPFQVMRTLKKSALATLVLGAGVVIANTLGAPLFLTVLVGIFTYFAILMLLKEELFGQLKTILEGEKNA